MAIKFKLTINVSGDFHIGTGAGRGRATDAVVLVDQRGIPFIPGSTIKGLCRAQACRLIDTFPGFGPKPVKPEDDERDGPRDVKGPLFEVFGGGTDDKHAERRVYFDHAYPRAGKSLTTSRSGRSARDRVSGRARDKHLFFHEDTGAARFETTLSCDDNLSAPALLLLLLSLRRVEALGGQRRRGKGRCEWTIQVIDAGSVADLKGLVLPAKDTSQDDRFLKLAEPILNRAKSQQVAEPPSPQESTTQESPSQESPTQESPTQESPTQALPEALGNAAGTPPGQIKPACWLVFAIAEAPLTLGHDQAVDNTISSEDFISGASVRGALAWQAIHDGTDPESEPFQDVFVREQVHFGPLYPAADQWTNTSSMTVPMPVPASFQTCKRFPGARGWPGKTVHGLADEMWRANDACEDCDSATRPAEGYVQLDGDADAVKIWLERPALHVFQRTAIDEDTQRGADSQLFGLESVPRGTRLAGYLWGDPKLLEQAFANRREKWTTIRVGKAKSRGQGLVGIFLRPATDDEHAEFPRLLPPRSVGGETTQAEAAASFLANPFFVTLYSDLIAVDEYLRPVTRMTAERLWQLLGQADAPPFALEQGFVRTRRIGGFIGTIGLPRSPDLAIAAGATWRFTWLADADDARKQFVWQRLRNAQAQGIGIRRGEGFGRLIVNLPLHVSKWESLQRRSHAVPCSPVAFPSRPSASLPTIRRRQPLQMLEQSPSQPSEGYQRLFAELAQSENPLTAVHELFADPLHRQDKAKSLRQELKNLRNPECEHREKLDFDLFDGDKCIAETLASNQQNVDKFRRILKSVSGENLEHV